LSLADFQKKILAMIESKIQIIFANLISSIY